MADDLQDLVQDGSEILDFQEDSLTEDGLVNKRNTRSQIWKYFGFQRKPMLEGPTKVLSL